MVVLYGFSLLYLIAGFLAYQLSWFQVLLISVFAYGVCRTLLKSWSSFLMTLLSLVIGSLGGFCWLYRQGALALTYERVMDFFEAYRLSVLVATVAIDLKHQALVIVVIGLVLIKCLQWGVARSEKSYLYIVIGSFIIVLVGFIGGFMGSQRDHNAFLVLVATLILYYFYNFYQHQSTFEPGFSPYLMITAVFLVLIIGGSKVLYTYDARPFIIDRVSLVGKYERQVDDKALSDLPEADNFTMLSGEAMPIASKFDFDGIEVFQVKGHDVTYLKDSVYEVYEAGTWSMDEALYMSKDNLEGVQKSKAFNAVDYLDYYQLDELEITLKNIRTNALPSAGYQVVKGEFMPGTTVYEDAVRGTYYSPSFVEAGYHYKLEIVVPMYGGRSFEALVRDNTEKSIPRALVPLGFGPGIDFQELQSLAREITKELNNPYNKALAIESYLRLNGRYNETPPIPPEGVDPIQYFLLESKEGFCQHFASAQVLMMRSVGIPSRLVRGFYLSEKEEDPEYFDAGYNINALDDGTLSVLDSDFHTWVEGYFPEVGWLVFEPTPGRYFRAMTYDDQDLTELKDENEARHKGSFLNIAWLYVVLGMAVVGTLSFMTFYVIHRNKRKKQRSHNETVSALMLLVVATLKGIGLVRQQGETLREFAVRVDGEFHTKDQLLLKQLMTIYEKAIYSNQSVDLDEVKALKTYYLKLREVVKDRLQPTSRLYLRLLAYRRL